MRSQTIDDAIRQAVERWPDSLALADAPNRGEIVGGSPMRLTWRELDNAVDNLSESLVRIGAGSGTKVAIQLPNVAELVLTILACGRIGAVAVPFPIQHRRHELNHGLRAAGAGVFVTTAWSSRPDQLAAVREVAASLDHPMRIATFGVGPTDGAIELAIDTTDSRFEAAGASPDSLLTICWTSGTTGTPKGVPRTASMWLASGYFQVNELGLQHDDRILCPFPVVNMAGIGGMLVPWAVVSAALFLHQPLDLPVFLQQIVTEKVSYTVAPPALLNMLLADESILAGGDLSHLGKLSSGSAPLDPWMVEGGSRLGAEIANVVGSHEVAARLATKATGPDPTQRARYFPRAPREGRGRSSGAPDTAGSCWEYSRCAGRRRPPPVGARSEPRGRAAWRQPAPPSVRPDRCRRRSDRMRKAVICSYLSSFRCWHLYS